MKLVFLSSVLFALLVMPTLAFASCTQITVMNPDGTMKFCTSCCHGGHCQVTCL